MPQRAPTTGSTHSGVPPRRSASDLGEDAYIAARIEQGLAGVINLAGEEILNALAPWAADPRALNGRREAELGQELVTRSP